jgi:hypothetical protein
MRGVLAERSVDLKYFLRHAPPSSLLATRRWWPRTRLRCGDLQELRARVPLQNELRRELLTALGGRQRCDSNLIHIH